MLEQSLEYLELSGFAISHFGGSTFSVYTIPDILSSDQLEKVIREIIDRLELFSKRSQGDEIIRDVCEVASAHAAMPAEQELSLTEMKILLAQWEGMGSPMSSRKDVPILVEFSMQELERRLKR